MAPQPLAPFTVAVTRMLVALNGGPVQEVCPFNVKFARELKEPAFAPREAIARKDSRRLARELLAMTQEEFSAAFKGRR